MTRGQIKTMIRSNLHDAGVTFYSEDDLNDSVQDAYDDIAALTKCILGKQTFNYIDDLAYYDAISDLGITDYLGAVAIFSNRNNRWLNDNVALRQLDSVRNDWEIHSGTPVEWTPTGITKFTIVPKTSGSGATDGAFNKLAFSNAYHIGTFGPHNNTFDLTYWRIAPQLIDDSSTFLIATDMQTLVEYYGTADLLEQAQEFIKAEDWWVSYYNDIETYKQRCANLAKIDSLLRV